MHRPRADYASECTPNHDYRFLSLGHACAYAYGWQVLFALFLAYKPLRGGLNSH